MLRQNFVNFFVGFLESLRYHNFILKLPVRTSAKNRTIGNRTSRGTPCIYNGDNLSDIDTENKMNQVN